ncbi:MAG: histidine kinase [Halolamina sp.]
MSRYTHVVGALLAVTLLFTAAAPAAAVPGEGATAQTDDCKNADHGPSGDAGPPAFVADVTPDFLSDLFATLPVPDVVKAAFGAPTCNG